ncbi:MAG: heme o synthase [Mycobacteriales bacterium]|nr:heme o synthase [Mycobacteriales bacterium]
MTTLAGPTGAPAAAGADAATVEPVSRAARTRAVVMAYVALTKPRIIELLLVTTVPTMVLAERGLPSLWLVAATLVGGSLAAGSANALNCWYDRDIDSVMQRTQRRSLVRHTVSDRGALVFGLVLGVVATAWLAATTNLLSALLADAAIAFYVLVYTMVLKRRTSQNIVWGGAAGCMPVVIGWSAVTGTLAWEALVLFLVVFFWTPPHFWALAMRYRDDYAAAGVPMLPVVATPRQVTVRMTAYSWAMVATSVLLAWPLGSSGAIYTVSAVVLGGVFLAEAHRLQAKVKRGADVNPMRLFHWSISYLALLFLAVAVDQLV